MQTIARDKPAEGRAGGVVRVERDGERDDDDINVTATSDATADRQMAGAKEGKRKGKEQLELRPDEVQLDRVLSRGRKVGEECGVVIKN